MLSKPGKIYKKAQFKYAQLQKTLCIQNIVKESTIQYFTMSSILNKKQVLQMCTSAQYKSNALDCFHNWDSLTCIVNLFKKEILKYVFFLLISYGGVNIQDVYD